MDRKKLLLLIGAILETLEECKTDGIFGGSPESHLWLGCQAMLPHLDQFQSVLNLMIESKVCTSKNHLVTITPKGSEMVAKVKAIRQEKVG